jgi:hypothetical protein
MQYVNPLWCDRHFDFQVGHIHTYSKAQRKTDIKVSYIGKKKEEIQMTLSLHPDLGVKGVPKVSALLEK